MLVCMRPIEDIIAMQYLYVQHNKVYTVQIKPFCNSRTDTRTDNAKKSKWGRIIRRRRLLMKAAHKASPGKKHNGEKKGPKRRTPEEDAENPKP